jgi:hypothetical protein
MLNVSAAITDPNLAQAYTIQRAVGAFALGGFVVASSTPINVTGVVTVAKERDLVQVPEGDRVTGSMLFYSVQQIYLSHGGAGAATSDTIVWRGDTYRIAKVWPYVDYGYWKALGVRMSGN